MDFPSFLRPFSSLFLLALPLGPFLDHGAKVEHFEQFSCMKSEEDWLAGYFWPFSLATLVGAVLDGLGNVFVESEAFVVDGAPLFALY